MSIFDLFKKIERERKASSQKPEWIIAGLGNPGRKYELTRHNAGFLMLDTFAGTLGVDICELKFRALCARCMVAGKGALLIKPQTFMNLSGESIAEAASFYKIPMERVIVVYDDVSLPVGKIRIREKGSAGGHNGIKNIIERSGTDAFPRIKIGVGSPPRPEHDMVGWVLGAFSDSERAVIETAIDSACRAVPEFIEHGFAAAAGKFN